MARALGTAQRACWLVLLLPSAAGRGPACSSHGGPAGGPERAASRSYTADWSPKSFIVNSTLIDMNSIHAGSMHSEENAQAPEAHSRAMHRAPRRAAALPKRAAHHSVDMELQMLGTRVGGAARRGAPPSWMLAIIVALQQLVGASRDTIGPPFHPRPVPPGCTTVGGQCIMPYPGNKWQHPKIHQSPDCCAFDPARAIVFCSLEHQQPQ